MSESLGNALAVRCRGLTKSYGKGAARVTALQGIDLEVRRSELLMIVGPSGCGKTTLLSIVSAMLYQDDGLCEVLGRDLARAAPVDRVRLRRDSIGFVFQMFNLLPALTAVENVAVPLLIRGEPRKRAFESAARLLEGAGLGDRATALPAQLSGGEQQRVAIARARIANPELIVCDEPTSNLDRGAGHDMMQALRDITQAGEATVLIVTHDDRILEFADRIAHMDDGRIVDIETAEQETES